MKPIADLEEQLNSFDPGERRHALEQLVSDHVDALAPEGPNFNMHIHSFFSYNAEGHSPSRIVWEARKAGLYAAGLCDFDVLDGLDEFLEAGACAGLRATVNLETRAYVAECADVDISSPGEQGVTYVMGGGFARRPQEGTPQAEGLAGYRHRARSRNEALIERINARVPEIVLDYEADVLPLTPAGAATERHIVSAYIRKARDVTGQHADEDALFWSGLLEKDFEETVELLSDEPQLEEAVRARLVKRGGIGYQAPSPDTFPPVEEFIRWVRSCGAIPLTTWLDGTSQGEADAQVLLESMQAKGAAGLNIIPDRNWNYADAATRELKSAKLAEVVAAANALHQPVNIGTEMNKRGLPFVDDLSGEALRPYRETFLRGARIMVGHTLLLRYADMSYIGEKAEAEFADVKLRNDFFESVGALPPMDQAAVKRLEDMGPEKAYGWFRDAI